MKAKIIITDDNGASYEHELQLVPSAQDQRRPGRQGKKDSGAHGRTPPVIPSNPPQGLDLSLPLRPFMKKHGVGLNGPQRFALLVARMAGGEAQKELPLASVEKQWNKMKGIMGASFNRSTSSRAKDRGWVDSPKSGYYVLLPGWKGLFTSA